MGRLLKEPLLHFILLGGLLFAAHAWWTAGQSAAERTIFVSSAEIERRIAIYASESGGLPSDGDIRGLISDYVRQEALAREARRLGLDTSDTVIERRLAQKMTFMVADLNAGEEASERVLRAWYTDHPDRFAVSPRLTFSHVFLSTDTREDAANSASKILTALNANPQTWKSMGDPFMLRRSYQDVSVEDLARQFGGEFAETMTNLPMGESWTGPVSSALGLHLIRLDGVKPRSVPPFEDIRSEIEKDWRSETQRANNIDAINQIVGRYDVIVEGVE